MDTHTSEEMVSNITYSVYGEVRRQYKKIILFVVCSIAWEILVFWIAKGNLGSADDFGVLFGLPFIAFAGWYWTVLYKIRRTFWRQTAQKYGWEYAESKNLDGERALLFKEGKTRSASFCISGTYNGHPIQIFEYSYSVKIGGKYEKNYYFTVFEITFSGIFPHLYLNYLRNGRSISPFTIMGLPALPLPTEFEKKFTLYAPKKYEIEAHQIFSPDTLVHLLDCGWIHDLELVDSEMIIVRTAKFNSAEELERELEIVKGFIDHLAPKLNRFNFEKIGDLNPMLST